MIIHLTSKLLMYSLINRDDHNVNHKKISIIDEVWWSFPAWKRIVKTTVKKIFEK